jgi:glycosyltransferase involved in cell wall biosynthesis
MNDTIKHPKILILVPAYNAAKYLIELTARVKQNAERCDILIINDGSSDNTEEILAKLDVIQLTNNPNQGKGYTLNRGFDYAVEHGYDNVITIDADLQHLPEELPFFIESCREYDMAIGTRPMQLGVMPFARWLTNNLTSLIISVFSGKRIRDTQSGYRMISVAALKKLRVKSVKYDFESEMLFQAGTLDIKIAEIPIKAIYEGSHSYINPFVDTGRFIKLIWKRILL